MFGFQREDALTGGDPGSGFEFGFRCGCEKTHREVSRSHSSYGNEPAPLKDSWRSHQSSEGLNVKLFQMQQGGLNPEFTSLILKGTSSTCVKSG